jgi:uncharacterized protein (DUF302 family)
MKLLKLISFLFVLSLFLGCHKETNKSEAVSNTQPIVEQVDSLVSLVKSITAGFEQVVTLDHHRMAKEVGVYTPASILSIFSNKKVNANLLQENQLVGLDLPFKILCYSEPDTTEVKLAFTSAEFIQKRHGLDLSLLREYNSLITEVIAQLPKRVIAKNDNSKVDKGYGIVNIKSDYDYITTIQKIKTVVKSQADTKWFADIDYQKAAIEIDISIRPTMLLLFGGPAPGGKAMMTSPRIGLDAFCQKLLVYENKDGEVWLAYNDIVSFAKLYYQTSTKPQQLINERLKTTFTKAVSK